jgi:hypothetical protein
MFDIEGREIISLVNEFQNAGEYYIKFDGCNLTSGVYFIRLKAGEFIDIKKCILIK